MTQKENLDELATQVMDVYLVQKRPILKGCIDFKRRNEARW